MALDHYISQVYLRNFYASSLGERMYATRKSNSESFTPDSKSICRIEENSTNTYLEDERAIEKLLRIIEPKYNKAIRNVSEGVIGNEDIFVISGFIAYINTCSPAAMRLGVPHLESILDQTTRMIDRAGKFEKPPAGLGGASITELLEANQIEIKVDQKYPQAVGIKSIMSLIQSFGNFDWEVLINQHEDNPFFTSDFPLVVERTSDFRVVNRVFPLTPYLAVRIMPKLSVKREECDLGFSKFRWRSVVITRSELLEVNRGIVRCAEELVIYSECRSWTKNFIEKNSKYRVEARTSRLPTGRGAFLISHLGVVEC